jgi:hypothetical protein
MQSNPVAKSAGAESLTFSPEASFAVHPKVPDTEPPDDEEEDDSEPGAPPEPVQTPKNPGDA